MGQVCFMTAGNATVTIGGRVLQASPDGPVMYEVGDATYGGPPPEISLAIPISRTRNKRMFYKLNNAFRPRARRLRTSKRS